MKRRKKIVKIREASRKQSRKTIEENQQSQKIFLWGKKKISEIDRPLSRSLGKKKISEIDRPLSRSKEERRHKPLISGMREGMQIFRHYEHIYAQGFNNIEKNRPDSLNTNYQNSSKSK